MTWTVEKHLYILADNPPVPTLAPEVCPAAATDEPVSTWAAERLGFHADDFQKEILDTPTHRLALCCSRQTGKSTVAAVKGLHFAVANPGSLILFAAPASRQSRELLRTFRAFAERLLKTRVKPDPGTPDSLLVQTDHLGNRIVQSHG